MIGFRIPTPVWLLALLAVGAGGYFLLARQKQEANLPPPVAPQGGLGFAYVDVAKQMGYTMRNRSGRDGIKEFILEAMPPGIAVADFNQDGWMDMYCPNGNNIVTFDRSLQRAQLLPPDKAPHNALYWNRKGKRFEEGAHAAGVDDESWSFGTIAGDFNNDGLPDIYVCNWGPNKLYLNNGDGTFRDVTASAGVAGDPRAWSTGACLVDYDGDGDLDLYVAQYADMYELLNDPVKCRIDADGTLHGRTCEWRKLQVYCGPLGLKPLNDVLYKNLLMETGKLQFEDVTRQAGIYIREGPHSRSMSSTGPYYGFQPISWDINGDGKPDIFVANDSVDNCCWINNGDGTFTDHALEMGLAMSQADSTAQASMGVAVGDVNGDGVLDVAMSEFSHDQFNLLIGRRLPDGRTVFDEKAHRTGLRQLTFKKLGWGSLLFDPDLNGTQDIFFACGHVYPEVDSMPSQETTYKQANLLILNEDPKTLRLRDVSAIAGPGLQIVKASRAAVRIDFDNDGDPDIATSALNDTPCLLRDDVLPSLHRHWLEVYLRGDPKQRVPLDPAGAFVTVTAGTLRQTHVLCFGSSFMSSEDPRLQFGLKDHDHADSVDVLWPNGKKTHLTNVQADRLITIDLRSQP